MGGSFLIKILLPNPQTQHTITYFSQNSPNQLQSYRNAQPYSAGGCAPRTP